MKFIKKFNESEQLSFDFPTPIGEKKITLTEEMIKSKNFKDYGLKAGNELELVFTHNGSEGKTFVYMYRDAHGYDPIYVIFHGGIIVAVFSVYEEIGYSHNEEVFVVGGQESVVIYSFKNKKADKHTIR